MEVNSSGLGKLLIFAGIILILVGVILLFVGKITGGPKLPGDILIKKDNFTFYFPLATSIIISIILTLLFFLINKFR